MVSAFTTFKNYDQQRQVCVCVCVCVCVAGMFVCVRNPTSLLIFSHTQPPTRQPIARPTTLQALMRAQLQRIMDTEGLSDNVFEIVSKSLKA